MKQKVIWSTREEKLCQGKEVEISPPLKVRSWVEATWIYSAITERASSLKLECTIQNVEPYNKNKMAETKKEWWQWDMYL